MNHANDEPLVEAAGGALASPNARSRLSAAAVSLRTLSLGAWTPLGAGRDATRATWLACLRGRGVATLLEMKEACIVADWDGWAG